MLLSQLLLLLIVIIYCSAQPPQDQVYSLPDVDFKSAGFKMYSGYLQANPTRKLHYIFVESQNNQNSKDTPITLWLNGGPGCSSLEGFVSEIGPFVFLYDNSTKLEPNPYSWNQHSHLMFLEAPAGVGYSVNEQSLNTYNFTDNNVAEDNYHALLDFFNNKFPVYKENPFWIVGESYGGIYAPTLALKIHKGKVLKNLQGVFSGNGAIEVEGNGLLYAEIDYLIQHNFVPPNEINKYQKNCVSKFSMTQCVKAVESIQTSVQFINPYNVYGYCFYEGDYELASMKRIPYELTILNGVKKAAKKASNKTSVPCETMKPLDDYFNRPEVKQALNMPANLSWYECVQLGNQKMHYQRSKKGSVHAIKDLIRSQKYKLIFYSGDADSVVPYLDTLRNLKRFKLKVKKEWRPYYAKPATQLSGFVETYKQGVTFATVRGAGHMVPAYRREEALYLFNQTIYGRSL